jgi:D-alanyl-D-alanine carboxypeptidase/D-alanyl-D-alanine-endopeptidase (penicillin-binding protein 4)
MRKPAAKLSKAFNRLQADSQCRYASVSLTVLDAKTGEQVFAANPIWVWLRLQH